jgi:ceramide glucosyltransferase
VVFTPASAPCDNRGEQCDLVPTPTLLTLLPTAIAIVLHLIVTLTFAVAMARRRPAEGVGAIERAPRVTILKPLAGADDDLPHNLDSFARLDYPAYEVLLGVASLDDPAAASARAFLRRHPTLEGRLVVTDPEAALNPKVAQLIGLDRHASGEIVVISDSNIRVPRGYLWSLVHALEQPGVGMVTSVFAGTGERSVGAALENLQLGSVTAPGVVAASKLLREPLTIGKSMAMRRRDLVRLGALHSVTNVLAEDHALGRIFLGAGYGVVTCLDRVDNRNVDCSIRRTLERHSRWAKLRRSIAPVPFVFEPLLSPLATASLLAIAVQSRASFFALLATVFLQTALAFASVRIARGRWMAWYYAPLEVVRTYLTLLCWGRAWFSRRISWRGHEFLLARDSAIIPAPQSGWSRLINAVRT